jgi:uncharacterized protein YbaR (Trm112 family)
MMVSEEFIKLTRCPETGDVLLRAPDGLCQQINAGIARRTVCNRGGRTLSRPIEGGLVNAGQTLLYPILDKLPRLLREEAIDVEQTAGTSRDAP